MSVGKKVKKIVLYSVLFLGGLLCLKFCLPPRIITFHGIPGSMKWGTQEGTIQLAIESNLWRQRRKRNVSRDLLPFTKKNDADVRLFAICALAKLESPLADGVHCGTFESALDNFYYNMALNRIRTRNLTGKARLEAISKSQGISWPELVEKSKIMNQKRQPKSLTMNDLFSRRVIIENYWPAVGDTAESLVLEEIVDVLYEMGRSGKNINGLADDLTLNEVQRLRLKCATMTEKQEAVLLLDYLVSQRVMTAEKGRVRDYLASMPQPEYDMILARQKDKKLALKYSGRVGYRYLFRIGPLVSAYSL